MTISNWKHDSLNWNFASYRKWLHKYKWVISKNPKLPRTAWPVAWPFVHIQPYFGCRRCRLLPELGHEYLVHSLGLEYPIKLKPHVIFNVYQVFYDAHSFTNYIFIRKKWTPDISFYLRSWINLFSFFRRHFLVFYLWNFYEKQVI